MLIFLIQASFTSNSRNGPKIDYDAQSFFNKKEDASLQGSINSHEEQNNVDSIDLNNFNLSQDALGNHMPQVTDASKNITTDENYNRNDIRGGFFNNPRDIKSVKDLGNMNKDIRLEGNGEEISNKTIKKQNTCEKNEEAETIRDRDNKKHDEIKEFNNIEKLNSKTMGALFRKEEIFDLNQAESELRKNIESQSISIENKTPGSSSINNIDLGQDYNFAHIMVTTLNDDSSKPLPKINIGNAETTNQLNNLQNSRDNRDESKDNYKSKDNFFNIIDENKIDHV
jgi:hypothetical protein